MKKIILLLLFALISSASQADLKKGLDAYQDENYDAAMAELKASAKTGGEKAKAMWASLCEKGGRLMDGDVDLDALRKAAANGYASAQNYLAVMYSKGIGGVEKDEEQALAWHEKAAENQHEGSMFDLGKIYENGDGVKKSAVEAYKWFSLSMAAGYDKALEARDAMAERMTEEELAQARKNASDWTSEQMTKLKKMMD